MKIRRIVYAFFASLAAALVLPATARAAEPLPSWNDGPAKQAILTFVAGAIDKNGPNYIAPEDRIATFDNDGTLWCEQPIVEILFTEDRLKKLAEKDPTLKDKQPFKAALEHDHAYFEKEGMNAVLELVVATHSNISQADFEEKVRVFFKTKKHPKFDKPITQMAYSPMVELLQFLRANGFQTWICSGGWMDLMRGVTQEAYGIPPQQVVGSSMKEKWLKKDGEYVLWLEPQLLSICDHDGKPVNIDLHIGKRPVFAAGNVRTGATSRC